MPRKITADQAAQVVTAYQAGESMAEINRLTGLAIQTIRRILAANGVEQRPYHTQEEMRLTIIELHLAGYNATGIARETGVTRQTVLNILKASNVYRRPPNAPRPFALRELPLVEIADRINAGETVYTLAKEFGVTFGGLRKRLEKDGLIPPQPRRTAKTGISPFEFIQAWQESSSLDEVCDRLGVSKKYVAARANAYRRQGVPLKEYGYGRSLDWRDLAEFAALFNDDDTEIAGRDS
jgi:transposase